MFMNPNTNTKCDHQRWQHKAYVYEKTDNLKTKAWMFDGDEIYNECVVNVVEQE